MNFDKLVPGSVVRYTIVGNFKYLSVHDFIMAVFKKTTTMQQKYGDFSVKIVKLK